MTTADTTLQGRSILVTRPAAQSAGLISRLEHAGAKAIPLPLLEIQTLPKGSPEFQQARQKIIDLDLFQHVIFISANAARLAGELIDEFWPQLPVRVQWLAIGQQTAAALDHYGIAAYHSALGYDSEALLASPVLQNIDGHKILICRGQGGREKLAQELSARGASVSYAEFYTRNCPRYSEQELAEKLVRQPPDDILITSSTALSNLLSLTKPELHNQLQQIHLVVPSQRIERDAANVGFKRITIAPGADDEAMLTALMSNAEIDK